MNKRPQIVISPVDPTWGTAQDRDTHLILVNPEIPANTGNIARLCAATGVVLHLVEPLGFVLQDRYLKRAGLDYWPHVTMCVHKSWEEVTKIFPKEKLHCLTTKSKRPHTEVSTEPGNAFVFGRESRGLQPEILAEQPHQFRIPITNQVRSLNLANSCSIVLYEVKRQQGWPDMS